MGFREERLKILQMVEQGTITPEEGARLLEALRKSTDTPPSAQSSRWLRVRVTDRSSGKTKVNVSIPLSLIDIGLRVGARFAPELEGIDLEELREALLSGLTGKLVEVSDEEEDQHVEIFVE